MLWNIAYVLGLFKNGVNIFFIENNDFFHAMTLCIDKYIWSTLRTAFSVNFRDWMQKLRHHYHQIAIWETCLCSGARQQHNAILIKIETNLQIYKCPGRTYVFDERSVIMLRTIFTGLTDIIEKNINVFFFKQLMNNNHTYHSSLLYPVRGKSIKK